MNIEKKVSVIIVAGGIGSRMKTTTPKQFLMLQDKPVINHCLDLFMTMDEVFEIVVVCAPQYHHMFKSVNPDIRLVCALPGPRRQDSVYNGLQSLTLGCRLVCIHDAVRPCITQDLVRRVLQAALEHGAATSGIPVKCTIKESDGQHFVRHTPDRSRLWEIQTPQAIQLDLLQQGFLKLQENGVTVTDDVSIVELLNLPVKLVEGCYTNLKITTLEDLTLAEHLLTKIGING